MLNLFSTTIESLYIHKVGNKSRNEGVFLAKEETQLNDELRLLMKEYFLKPFREKEENYLKFLTPENQLQNFLDDMSDIFFTGGAKMDTISEMIANHLYEQHSHPHIKAGEVYICHLNDMMIDNERVDGIGIFKSEVKQDFLQFAKDDNHLDVILSQGVNLSKLDKGVIIFNTASDEGYKILSVDQNRYDTKYWLDSFLGVIEFEDSNFYTKKYLKFCQSFAKEAVLPAEDKKEAVMFMNGAYNHFAKNDEFNEDRFLNEVVRNPDLIPEFKEYKNQNAAKYSIEDLSDFAISPTAVKESQKKFKSIIELDTNVSIKMSFVNPESAEKFIEKGWDEERQMYYYLVYFNKEKK